MQEISPNWIALVVAVVVKQVIGAGWFSPLAFGPQWCALTGVKESEMRARLPKVLPIEFVASLVMAFVLVHAIRYAGADGWGLGAVVGFLDWLGYRRRDLAQQCSLRTPFAETLCDRHGLLAGRSDRYGRDSRRVALTGGKTLLTFSRRRG